VTAVVLTLVAIEEATLFDPYTLAVLVNAVGKV
jgi:hypothetical protein